MLKPEIPQDQLDAVRPILESLLARLGSQVEKLPPQADSALVYILGPRQGHDEAGR